MEIKEYKTENFILNEIEKLLGKIINDMGNRYQPTLEVTKVYFDSIKCISKSRICKSTLLGIVIHEEKIYDNIVSVSFEDRELKIKIYDSNELLNFTVREEFVEFATKNKNSIKFLCFIKDF